MKSKKSQIAFSIILVMISIAILVYVLFSYIDKQNNFDKKLGQRQLEILETYQNGQNALFYLDSAAEFATNQALFNITNNGGYDGVKEDIKKDGYVFWRKNKEENFPAKKDIRKGLAKEILTNFNLYLNFVDFNFDYDIAINRDNVSFYNSIPIYLDVLSGGRVYGKIERYKLSNPWWNFIALGAPREETQSYVGVYALKHSYKTKLKMDLDFFEYVSNEAKNISDSIEACNDDFKKCVDKTVNEKERAGDWNYHILIDERIILFDVSNGAKEIIYSKENKKFEVKNITIKFALVIGDKTPPEPVTDIQVYDKLTAERSLIVTWKKSPTEDKEKDIDKYVIYYSDAPFKDTEGFADKIESQTSLDFGSEKEFDDVDFENCREDNSCKSCVYPGIDAAETIRDNKLYYSKKDEVYFTFISVPEDNTPYFFAVAAVDKSQNVINNSAEGQFLTPFENYLGAYSKDDLAPAEVINLASSGSVIKWEKPEKNIDGSKLVEEDGEMTYSIYRDGQNHGVVSNNLLDWSDLPEGNYEAGIVAIDEEKNYCKEKMSSISITIKKEN